MQIEVDELASLDQRLADLFSDAILLLAEFLLLDCEHSAEMEKTSVAMTTSGKVRRNHSVGDGQWTHSKLLISVELKHGGLLVACWIRKLKV